MGPDQRLVFRSKFWQPFIVAMALLLVSVLSHAQSDSAKYSRINGYGFFYKRFGVDSVFMVPLSTSPHTPYRKGGIRYNPTDSSFEYYTGYQWLKSGGAATNGIDTVYTIGDSIQIIETTDETFATRLWTPARLNVDTLFVGNDTIILPPPDGTETKILPGANITIIGDGSTTTPYELFVPFFLEDIQISNDTLYYYINGTRWFAGILPTTAEFILNNALGGTGDTLVNADKEVKTLAAGYGIDRAANGTTVTHSVDTSEVATPYDLTQITSGINQLTGDVTAGPGSGSQATTITNNAVTDAKLRQGAATSVIGRSANSTGNVADIVATIASTYLKRNSTTVLWDSVDYADLKNRPDLQNPGVYFSPGESFDPTFVVFASAIPRTSNAFSQGNPIEWEILDHTTDHNSSFFDSAYGGGAGQLIVRFPTVKNVINTTITPDETGAENLNSVGSSTALDQFDAYVFRPIPVSIRLSGNGTTTWVENSSLTLASYFDMSTFSTSDGGTSFNIAAGFNIEYQGVSINYIGANDYRLKRSYSGLGAYNVRFNLLDEFGNPVTSNPTTDDVVTITGAASGSKILQLNTWTADNSLLDGFFNFWIFGAYECWIVAAPVSTTSIQVRWQPTYPSATNYKIYRATSLYGSRTLVHTGTSGSYTDSGLSADTLYWYFMIAVIGGVDTEITYFRTNTKSF